MEALLYYFHTESRSSQGYMVEYMNRTTGKLSESTTLCKSMSWQFLSLLLQQVLFSECGKQLLFSWLQTPAATS